MDGIGGEEEEEVEEEEVEEQEEEVERTEYVGDCGGTAKRGE